MTEDYGYHTSITLLHAGNPPIAFLDLAMIPAIGIRRTILRQGLSHGARRVSDHA